MPNKRLRLSLANKCQLLFGAAVLIILSAALSVVWLRMQTLVEQSPRQQAENLAHLWMTGQIDLDGTSPPAETAIEPLDIDRQLQLTLIDAPAFDRLAERDSFFERAIQRFEANVGSEASFRRDTDAIGNPYYRYARAVRASDLVRLGGEDELAAAPPANADDPLQQVLFIQLRDADTAAQMMVNRIYIVAAGLFAGLLAIGVFWFITMRLILSPVRVLRDVAAKVSAGDLNTRSDINTGDELEELSDAFNDMLASQKEKQDQLRSINKSLDIKVDELAASNVALYEANKMKGEFLANVSHELRTPLNSMIGFAEVLEETLQDRTGPVDEKRKRYVNNIITSSRRLLDLINDLLDLAKIEAGRMDLNVTAISIADTFEGLTNLIRPQAEKRNIELRVSIDPNMPVVQTDAGKLHQILFNFLANAVKFTPDGGTITLAATIQPEAQRQAHATPEPAVRLSVTDTGPGIAPEDQHRIFEKFTQLDPSVTKQHGGTGLGLTISQQLAEMLQGTIELDSVPGQGATFTLVLPAVLQRRTAPLMPEAAARRPRNSVTVEHEAE